MCHLLYKSLHHLTTGHLLALSSSSSNRMNMLKLTVLIHPLLLIIFTIISREEVLEKVWRGVVLPLAQELGEGERRVELREPLVLFLAPRRGLCLSLRFKSDRQIGINILIMIMNWFQGASIYDVQTEEGRVNWKKNKEREAGKGRLRENADKGEGSKKSKNFADVMNRGPLNDLLQCSLYLWREPCGCCLRRHPRHLRRRRHCWCCR